MNIAILGANSHIAKNLLIRFISQNEISLSLFARNPISVSNFFNENKITIPGYEISDYSKFTAGFYDAIFNCVGIADPLKQKTAGIQVFQATEIYDNMALKYIMEHPETKYINFSSGAVYGTSFSEPVNRETIAEYKVNELTAGDFYRVAKLNSEAKHRSLQGLSIIDFRIFSFFSRYIDLHTNFLLTEIINCIKKDEVFKTNEIDIVRDYIHPDDLFEIIMFYLEQTVRINNAIDIYSKHPITKFEIISLFEHKYGLKFEITNSDTVSVTGLKKIYYSQNESSDIDKIVKNTSRNCLDSETAFILGNKGFKLD